jgi:hypothetical protein
MMASTAARGRSPLAEITSKTTELPSDPKFWEALITFSAKTAKERRPISDGPNNNNDTLSRKGMTGG